MRFSERRARYVRIGYVFLLLVSAAQLAWWLYDQWTYSDLVVRRETELHATLAEGARALLRAGMEPEALRELMPQVIVHGDGAVIVRPEVGELLAEERARRLNRYAWEGGFFFVVLVAGISILARAVRAEVLLRRRQENFLAAVSHELRSPLATSRVAAETLELREPPAEERRRLVGRIIRNLTRLETMVSNLLDTARLEEGRLVLRPSTVDLAETLAGTVAMFEERAVTERVSLASEMPPGLLLSVDEEALRAVARNLLENAFAAVAGVSEPRVEAGAGESAGRIWLEVRDNGRGFDPQEAERLFQKFYRPGDEMRRGGRGAGLGLYLVRELVMRSGGTVQAHSAGPGAGARVRVSLPAVQTVQEGNP